MQLESREVAAEWFKAHQEMLLDIEQKVAAGRALPKQEQDAIGKKTHRRRLGSVRYRREEWSVFSDGLTRRFEVTPELGSELVPELDFELELQKLRDLDDVKWACVCQDHGKEYVAVHVGHIDPFPPEPVQCVIDTWRASSLAALPLTVFDTLAQLFLDFKLTAHDCRKGQRWWLDHEVAVRDLFAAHSNLVAAYVDIASRGGEPAGLALVCVVSHKGFIPRLEEEFPETFLDLPIDVRSRKGSMSRKEAAAMARNLQGEPACYVGESIGGNSDNQGAGTLGAVVVKNGTTQGLTAAHNVVRAEKITLPAARDLYGRRKLQRECKVTESYDDGETHSGQVYMDAALVKLTSPTAQWTARTTWIEEDRAYYIQSGLCRTLFNTLPMTCVYFGRSNGKMKATLIASGYAHVRVKNQVVHNQLMFKTDLSYYQGDFGSVVWAEKRQYDLPYGNLCAPPYDDGKTGDEGRSIEIDAVGLLWYEIAAATGTLVLATPIQPILDRFECQLASFHHHPLVVFVSELRNSSDPSQFMKQCEKAFR